MMVMVCCRPTCIILVLVLWTFYPFKDSLSMRGVGNRQRIERLGRLERARRPRPFHNIPQTCCRCRWVLSHGLAAVLAFSMGQFWARRISSWTDASVSACRFSCGGLVTSFHGVVVPPLDVDEIDSEAASPSFLLETPALLGTLIRAGPLEFRLGSGIPWIEDRGIEQGRVLLLRPAVADAVCQALDVVWLQNPTDAQDCFVVVPWSEGDFPSSLAVSPHRLIRLAFERKGLYTAAGVGKWDILPWEAHPDLVDHKPFRLQTPPKPVILRKAASVLQHYLRDLPEMLQVLQPLVAKAHRHAVTHPTKVLTILLSNRGHVDLLVNFVCGWKALSSDEQDQEAKALGQILVFAADRETAEAANSLGLTVFYHPSFLGEGSGDGAAANYGSPEYAQLMLAKMFCAHMISVLGYDFVFHDVDIVPLRSDYLRPLLSPSGSSHDVYDMHFQYDFAGIGSVQQIQPEYRPWLINSGLYFVRSNARTRDFFDAMLRQVDLVVRSRSHQAVMTTLLGEHVSRYGLRVRVLREEADNMPGGYHFSKRWDFMRAMLNGTIHPYLFHMNYNENKETKQKFNEQIGTWYVRESCVADSLSSSASLASCCISHPQFRCHFRDKPSQLPCRSSSVLEGGISFW